MTDLARNGIKPTASLRSAVFVEFHRPQPDRFVQYKDDGTVQRFLDWLCEQRIDRIPLTRSVIQPEVGFYAGTFDAKHAEAIGAWIGEHLPAELFEMDGRSD